MKSYIPDKPDAELVLLSDGYGALSPKKHIEYLESHRGEMDNVDEAIAHHEEKGGKQWG